MRLLIIYCTSVLFIIILCSFRGRITSILALIASIATAIFVSMVKLLLIYAATSSTNIDNFSSNGILIATSTLAEDASRILFVILALKYRPKTAFLFCIYLSLFFSALEGYKIVSFFDAINPSIVDRATIILFIAILFLRFPLHLLFNYLIYISIRIRKLYYITPIYVAHALLDFYIYCLGVANSDISRGFYGILEGDLVFFVILIVICLAICLFEGGSNTKTAHFDDSSLN